MVVDGVGETWSTPESGGQGWDGDKSNSAKVFERSDSHFYK